jgi:hypothetical protein
VVQAAESGIVRRIGGTVARASFCGPSFIHPFENKFRPLDGFIYPDFFYEIGFIGLHHFLKFSSTEKCGGKENGLFQSLILRVRLSRGIDLFHCQELLHLKDVARDAASYFPRRPVVIKYRHNSYPGFADFVFL